MCWYGSNSSRKVAKEDITCYKILKKDKDSSELTSKYYTFTYELKKLYKTQICTRRNRIDDDKIYINEGFHSYDKNIVIKLQNDRNSAIVNVFSKHKVFLHELISSNLVLVECTIPKGSIYYKNVYNEIVSNQIIVNREIRWEELKNTWSY